MPLQGEEQEEHLYYRPKIERLVPRQGSALAEVVGWQTQHLMSQEVSLHQQRHTGKRFPAVIRLPLGFRAETVEQHSVLIHFPVFDNLVSRWSFGTKASRRNTGRHADDVLWLTFQVGKDVVDGPFVEKLDAFGGVIGMMWGQHDLLAR